MVDLADPRTFWLNVTNLALGIMVGAVLLILVRCLVWEAMRRRVSRFGSHGATPQIPDCLSEYDFQDLSRRRPARTARRGIAVQGLSYRAKVLESTGAHVLGRCQCQVDWRVRKLTRGQSTW